MNEAADISISSYSSFPSQDESEYVLPPFPFEALPSSVRRYVEEGATAIGVPPEMIAVPMLAFAAAAIGKKVRLQLKKGFEVRPILWTAVVARPGSAKSPRNLKGRAPEIGW